MIRGLHIHPYMVSGSITITVVTFRMLAMHFGTWNPVIAFFMNPIVVFILLLVAGIVVLYPHFHGFKVVIISIALCVFVAFFVFSYYIM